MKHREKSFVLIPVQSKGRMYHSLSFEINHNYLHLKCVVFQFKEEQCFNLGLWQPFIFSVINLILPRHRRMGGQ